METLQNKNLACRIFKEQIDLVLQLPENERAEVLYKAILSAFNQIENQIENQNENQNEYAYVSVSVSVSDSLSVLGKTVFSLLKKNITCKEFSNNYGGRRINAGRPKNQIENQVEKQPPKTIPNSLGDFTPPIETEVLEYAKQQNELAGMGGYTVTPEQAQDFYDYYSGIGWRLPNDAQTPIRDWKRFLRKWACNPKFKPKPEPEDDEPFYI